MNAPSEQEAVAVPGFRAAVSGRTSDGGEAALLEAAQRGSADAVEALVRRHWDGAHRAAYLIVQDAAAAEDIAQEGMVAAMKAIQGFDRRRPLRPWLHRIVVNRSIDWVRARRRRAEVSVDRVSVEAGEEMSLPAEAGLSDVLLEALAGLDPEDRAIVVMRHLLDYSGPEVAKTIGLPPATVRTRLRRALEQIRLRLGDDYEETR